VSGRRTWLDGSPIDASGDHRPDESPQAHDAHVVQKIRAGGDRDGETTYYLVGPQRAILRDAEEDLARYRGSRLSRPGYELVGELQGQLASLRGALEEAREAIASLPEDALGQGRSIINDRQTGEPSELVWPIRDELADRITKALAPGAGKREGAVLRAALTIADATEYWLEWDNDAQVGVCIPCGRHAERSEDIPHDEDCPIAVFVAYRDALRDGEG
jgi:hypothetical protein